ncbi:hypothetical protein TanjilG_28745 [Lupinus angustifolius]|uniref:BAH domain-containing protein n=1 Tax=Lupinus angustifolius TaxID=3871 RepID=A0A1J7IQT1_LUPAN|nr:PREDICTED: uncharacterized protein LOC109337529 [Lupinus angustifolius]OIW16688.1 hypothetical protein TanjilG_28745 [Lupinus angustifolius]
MERLAGSSAATTSYHGYVSWEEVFVSSEKGRRVVHYFLKRQSGDSDLAVIGKEKSLRHMHYRYALKNPSLGPYLKPKSRREVIDWLDSIVSDSSAEDVSHAADEDVCGSEIQTLKDNQSRKLSLFTKEFTWLGSPWTCRKRRNHYQSFKRNGFQISVYDFVYILAEEDKHLVAYLEDLYEDSRGNKMVMVRWFHKIDEVSIVLPHNFSDREVFFSHYLQDLSVECIDGLASVLSPQHYKKFPNEAHYTHLEPFVCEHQFGDNGVKPFDITQIRGYWKQEILRYMYTPSDSKSNDSSGQSKPNGSSGQSKSNGSSGQSKSNGSSGQSMSNGSSGQSMFNGRSGKSKSNRSSGQSKSNGSSGKSDDSSELEDNLQCANGIRPKKRQRCTKVDVKESVDLAALRLENLTCSKINMKISARNDSSKIVGPTTLANVKETNATSQHFVVGSEVEVLSQDSGIRGCWFRASVIKKHKDKVKVQYQDVQDAVDEAKKLEEWIPASRVVVPDDMGLRMHGRTKIRPALESNKPGISWLGGVGSIVDAWWHDGWWEGIVVLEESDAKYHVYFPGGKVLSTFGPDKLRHSQDWSGNGWVNMKERPDLVTSILTSLKTKQESSKSYDSKSTVASGDRVESKQSYTCLDFKTYKPKKFEVVPDLLKNDLFPQLRWMTKKRRQYSSTSCQNLPKVVESDSSDCFVIPASMKVDHENYNYGGDPSIYSSSVVPSLTNLVTCR